MLSGGVDSTWALYYYLKTTNLPIYTHHIIIRGENKYRYKLEIESTKNILNWCNKNYPGRIKVSSNSEFFIEFKYMGYDIDLVFFVGSVIATKLPGLTGIACGYNNGDLINDINKDTKCTGYDICRVYSKKFYNIFKDPLEPGIYKNKIDMINELPKDLFELTWSCRRPIVDKPCGICRSCLANKGL